METNLSFVPYHILNGWCPTSSQKQGNVPEEEEGEGEHVEGPRIAWLGAFCEDCRAKDEYADESRQRIWTKKGVSPTRESSRATTKPPGAGASGHLDLVLSFRDPLRFLSSSSSLLLPASAMPGMVRTRPSSRTFVS
ncbi:hypothetical protein NL676_013368 [Syzygium grande]|nr:hypothetical protein NL676_013368 [Syzygium grande]